MNSRSDIISIWYVTMAIVLGYMATCTPLTSYALSADLVPQTYFDVEREPTTVFLKDYTTLFVPYSKDIEQTGLLGTIAIGDWVSVKFILNEGRTLYDGTNEFRPLRCFYKYTSYVLGQHAHPTFQGCYSNLAESKQTPTSSDIVDSHFTQGEQVYFASRVVTQFIRGLQPPSYLPISWFSIPRIKVGISLYEQTYVDRQTGVFDIWLTTPESMADDIRFSHPIRAINTYIKAFPSSNYASFFELFADAIRFEVVGLANYTGRQVAFDYQRLADYSVSDIIRTNGVGTLRCTQTGHVCLCKVMMLSEYPRNPTPTRYWDNTYAFEIEFNRLGQMAKFQQMVNLYGAVIRRPDAGVLNITKTCEIIQEACTNDVYLDQYPGEFRGAQQYNSIQECIDHVSSLRVTGPTPGDLQTSGRNQRCINWHAELSMASPHHCLHAGPLCINPEFTPCCDF